jgi:aerobic-type carbon monoxide dehydrogenase small subunit (CoxS/CutS family)
MTEFTHINGRPIPLDPQRPERRLIDILREDLNLTGAKPGCHVGRCGACTVWVNGLPVPSCLVLSGKLKGAIVITIESTPVSSAVRAALVAQGGFQCGYCTAGFVMSLESQAVAYGDRRFTRRTSVPLHRLCGRPARARHLVLSNPRLTVRRRDLRVADYGAY